MENLRAMISHQSYDLLGQVNYLVDSFDDFCFSDVEILFSSANKAGLDTAVCNRRRAI